MNITVKASMDAGDGEKSIPVEGKSEDKTTKGSFKIKVTKKEGTDQKKNQEDQQE